MVHRRSCNINGRLPDMEVGADREVEEIVKAAEVLNLDSSSEDDEEVSFETEDSSSYDVDDSDASFKIEDETEDAASSKFVEEVSSLPPDNVPDEKVAELIKGDLKKITVKVCQSYLRRHGLRLSGNKAELIDRIKLHIQLKEEGPRKYHLSTFAVNCTGDVCKGDVVLFVQKVHAKLGASPGWRRVAGRVISENYGDKRQQHTFTIEVMWSSGCKVLSPMKQLLVKGRNLYRKGTRRQLWPDEQARKRILDEKHGRGAVARQGRANSVKLKGISCHGQKKKAVVIVRSVGTIQRDLSNGTQPPVGCVLPIISQRSSSHKPLAQASHVSLASQGDEVSVHTDSQCIGKYRPAKPCKGSQARGHRLHRFSSAPPVRIGNCIDVDHGNDNPQRISSSLSHTSQSSQSPSCQFTSRSLPSCPSHSLPSSQSSSSGHMFRPSHNLQSFQSSSHGHRSHHIHRSPFRPFHDARSFQASRHGPVMHRQNWSERNSSSQDQISNQFPGEIASSQVAGNGSLHVHRHNRDQNTLSWGHTSSSAHKEPRFRAAEDRNNEGFGISGDRNYRHDKPRRNSNFRGRRFYPSNRSPFVNISSNRDNSVQKIAVLSDHV